MPASSCDEPLVLDGDGKWTGAPGMNQKELACRGRSSEKASALQGPASQGETQVVRKSVMMVGQLCSIGTMHCLPQS